MRRFQPLGTLVGNKFPGNFFFGKFPEFPGNSETIPISLKRERESAIPDLARAMRSLVSRDGAFVAGHATSASPGSRLRTKTLTKTYNQSPTSFKPTLPQPKPKLDRSRPQHPGLGEKERGSR
jgi:hypothetical protein